MLRGARPGTRAQQSRDPFVQRQRDIEQDVEREAREQFVRDEARGFADDERQQRRADAMRERRAQQRQEAKRRREGQSFDLEENIAALEAEGIDARQIVADLKAEGLDLERDAGLSMAQLKQRELNQREPGGLRELSRGALKKRGGQEEFGGDAGQLQNFGGRPKKGENRQQAQYEKAREEYLNAQRPDEGLQRSYDERRAAQGTYRLPKDRPEGLFAYLDEKINRQTVERLPGESDTAFDSRIEEKKEKAAWAISLSGGKEPYQLQKSDQPIQKIVRDDYGNIVGIDDSKVRSASPEDFVGGDMLAQDMGLMQGGEESLDQTRRVIRENGKPAVDSEGRVRFTYPLEKANQFQGNAGGAMAEAASRVKQMVANGEVSLDDEFNGVPVWKTLENLERHTQGRVELSRMRSEGRRAVQDADRRLRGEYTEDDIDLIVRREARGMAGNDMAQSLSKRGDTIKLTPVEATALVERLEAVSPGSAERLVSAGILENANKNMGDVNLYNFVGADDFVEINRPALQRAIRGEGPAPAVNQSTGAITAASADEQIALASKMRANVSGAESRHRERMIQNIQKAQEEAVGQIANVPEIRGQINASYQSGGSANAGLGPVEDPNVNFGRNMGTAPMAEPLIVQGPAAMSPDGEVGQFPMVGGYADKRNPQVPLGKADLELDTLNDESFGEAWVRDHLYTEWDVNGNSVEPPVAKNISGTLQELTNRFAKAGIEFDHTMRSIGDLENASAAYIELRQRQGKNFYRKDENGKQIKIDDPDISDVLNTIGFKGSGQQKEIARSLYQLEQANLNNVNTRQKERFENGQPMFQDEAGNAIAVMRPAPPRVQPRQYPRMETRIGTDGQPRQVQVNAAANQEPVFDAVRDVYRDDPRPQRFGVERGATIAGVGAEVIGDPNSPTVRAFQAQKKDKRRVSIKAQLAKLDPMARIKASQDLAIEQRAEEIGRQLTAREADAVRQGVFEDLDGLEVLLDRNDMQSPFVGREINDPNVGKAALPMVYQGMTDGQIEYYYRQREARNRRRDGSVDDKFKYNPELVAIRQKQARLLREKVAQDGINAEARQRQNFPNNEQYKENVAREIQQRQYAEQQAYQASRSRVTGPQAVAGSPDVFRPQPQVDPNMIARPNVAPMSASGQRMLPPGMQAPTSPIDMMQMLQQREQVSINAPTSFGNLNAPNNTNTTRTPGGALVSAPVGRPVPRNLAVQPANVQVIDPATAMGMPQAGIPTQSILPPIDTPYGSTQQLGPGNALNARLRQDIINRRNRNLGLAAGGALTGMTGLGLIANESRNREEEERKRAQEQILMNM